MEDQQAINVVETALLCADTPMSVGALQKLFEPEEVSTEQVRNWLETLQINWQDRGLELVEIATGWRFQSRTQMQRFLERLNPERAPKYSRAVLETLAIIAWKQPVTRGDIEAIRGVTVSSQIVKTLEDRGWVETIGHRDGPGRPALLGTTKSFLDDLGLRALDELPALQPIAEQVQQGSELILSQEDSQSQAPTEAVAGHDAAADEIALADDGPEATQQVSLAEQPEATERNEENPGTKNTVQTNSAPENEPVEPSVDTEADCEPSEQAVESGYPEQNEVTGFEAPAMSDSSAGDEGLIQRLDHETIELVDAVDQSEPSSESAGVTKEVELDMGELRPAPDQGISTDTEADSFNPISKREPE